MLTGSEWEAHAVDVVRAEALRQRDDFLLCESLHDIAGRHPQHPVGLSPSALEELLHIDALSARVQGVRLPRLDAVLTARERIIAENPTCFVVEALCEVGLVRDAAVAAAAKDASARLRIATLGQSRVLPSGRLDLAARRRFDVLRDAALRPLLTPPPPVVSVAGETADLRFLPDEAEYDWVRMVPNHDRRIRTVPRFPVSHRDARLITGWSAAALDSRLARGARWDSVLDAARIERTDADRDAVIFDPRRFMVWWTALAN
jgi:hypothetical protein